MAGVKTDTSIPLALALATDDAADQRRGDDRAEGAEALLDGRAAGGPVRFGPAVQAADRDAARQFVLGADPEPVRRQQAQQPLPRCWLCQFPSRRRPLPLWLLLQRPVSRRQLFL